MISNIFFDRSAVASPAEKPGIYLLIAAALTFGFIVFALMFQGVQGLSRGGFLMAALSSLWVVAGVLGQKVNFPLVLLLPVMFLLFIAVTGLQLDIYPTEYVLRLFTVWIGAISIAVFVANGLSMGFVVLALILVCVANLVAIALGYDTYQLNVNDYDQQSLKYVEIRRFSGLAGQVNKLVGIMFTLPFAAFLLRKKIGLLPFMMLLGVCVATAVLTASRSTLLFTPLFVVAGSTWLLARGPTRTLLILVGLAGAIVVGTFLSSDRAVSRIENSSLHELVLVQRALNAIDGDGSTEARAEFATGFWPYFFEKPIIGWGPYAFKDITGAETYAHNNFAELAVDVGSIGLLLYYSMYAVALVLILRRGGQQLALLAPLAFLVTADLMFVTIEARGLIMLLCLMLAVAAGSSASGSRGRRARRRHRRPRSA